MNSLYETQRLILSKLNTSFVRYKAKEIKWNNRMLGLVGPRGVGKTTLFLQQIAKSENRREHLYVSADNIYFSNHTLVDLANQFSIYGGKYLYIDEIHRYSDWSVELKNIYDSHPDLHVYFTGSSLLDICQGAADLSRRAPIYEMQGLSFREYLDIFHGIKMEPISLQRIINGETSIPNILHPLPLFKEYLKKGYYPFGNDEEFFLELQQIINTTLEVDIPQYADMTVATSRKLKQLLALISESVPFKPVMQKIAEIINVSRNSLSDYFCYLERAGLIAMVRDTTSGIRGLGKTEKVFLDNTNLIYALSAQQANIGNIRETFFYNQMRVLYPIKTSKVSDFEIDGMTFEIGGSNKGHKQISGIDNSYIVKDDIEVGFGNIIPLWAFGLTY